MLRNDQDLYSLIDVTGPWDAIVVEGYDGVGKGRILSSLAERYQVVPYRPDYNLWQLYDHRQIDRWKISGFFWDVYSHFMDGEVGARKRPFLFDRGVISGAVYNDDQTIAMNYKKLLRDRRVLHVLVTCDEEDYQEFDKIRQSKSPANYYACREYTEEYKRLLTIAGVDYVVYKNKYDKSIAQRLSQTCEGCGHYSYGICRNPKVNRCVDKHTMRCDHSSDKEVQDVSVDEVHCM